MGPAAIALALHLAAPLPSAVRVASASAPTSLETPQTAPAETPLWPEPPPRKAPRAEFDAAFLLALGTPTTPGVAVRGRIRLVAGLWAHTGVSARGGTAPVAGGVREIPFELGLGYRIPLGAHFGLGLRGEAISMSRQMAVAKAASQHRWLGGVRGGVEARVNLNEDFGFTLLVGAEGRLGRTEVNVAGAGAGVFTPVAPYFELGPSLTF